MLEAEKKAKSKTRRIVGRVLTVFAIAFVATRLFPETLIWPHKATIGDTQIYSEQPIGREMASVLAQSDALLHNSKIYSDGYGKRIFLTDGSWRWKFLALNLSGAFAQSTHITEAIVINRSSINANLVRNGSVIGGERKLSSVIAHERTHGLIRARYGLFASRFQPVWKREGYCDYIAGDTSLSATEVAELEQKGTPHPAIIYFKGRERVLQILEVEGKTVDQLFAD